jgi:hypothetical protein
MTGYQSKKDMAQDKLAQPKQEPVAVQKSGIANSPSDPEICNERSAQACGPVYCGDSGGYCNKCPKQKTIQTVKACKGMNCGCTDGRSHSLECLAELAAAIAGGVFVQEVLAQPEQERTDYAVHLNHCNIGECQGVCKYLDDDCPALKHADMKAKWDSPATQQPAQEPVADGLIRQYITALLANKPDEAATATKAMVDYVYTTPPQRPWVGLTNEEIQELRKNFATLPAIAAIEAKLKEKNS